MLIDCKHWQRVHKMNFCKGQKVRYNYDNSVGTITGRKQGDRWQVKFDAATNMFIPATKLEAISETDDMFDALQEGKFQGIDDFRRSLYCHRLSGKLTNIIYSMNNSKAKFLPHQFIPVIKFLESYTDRLLIADEVGLGKTIESMYIWEELRVRSNAKRLLIVVPSVLRFKWQSDLKNFFNINAIIASAQNANLGKTLLQHINDSILRPEGERFVIIISLEGLRVSEKVKTSLEEHKDRRKIFDMVIIDEAHNLRNRETKSFKMGELLRDVCENFLLLSATPIQTGSENFYNLLNLLSPEDFYDKNTFDMQLEENAPLVRLTNAIDSGEGQNEILEKIEETLEEDIFYKDSDIAEIRNNLPQILTSQEKIIEVIQKLKNKYFYNAFVTRTRKRDVMENRTQRVAEVISFELADYEKSFYDEVTKFLKTKNIAMGDSLNIFRLIARQRQMASCIPAALKGWRADSKRTIKQGNFEEDEFFFQDLSNENDIDLDNTKFNMPIFENFDLEKLEANDSKFNKFLTFIKSILKENMEEKIIVFSFFRNTVAYICKRLNDENINTTYIMGGMSGNEKNQQIENFQNGAINVLVSSEVGAEGIDLQFAKYEINYDLPWNPMRLEQRIGRIDRIGQKSPKIFILNAFCKNTIEDRILERLYERIDVFKNTLGDIEEILGKEIQDLQIDVFNNSYETDEEIEKRTLQVQKAIVNNQRINKSLESQSGNLSAYQNFILENIKNANENFRYVTPKELIFTVKDLLHKNFPGSSVEETTYPDTVKISLSQEARDKLADFIRMNAISSYTVLHTERHSTYCSFNNKTVSNLKRIGYKESIDINHPLIKWILSILKENAIYTSGCSAICIKKSALPNEINMPAGMYSYYIQKWSANGVRLINELHYFLINSYTNSILENDVAERILITALLYGDTFDKNLVSDEQLELILEAMNKLYENAFDQFEKFRSSHEEQNKSLFTEQTEYIKRTATIKAKNIEEMIEKMEEAGREKNIIRMNQGRLNKINEDKDNRIRHLEKKLNSEPTCGEIATGLLVIEDN